MASDVRTIAYGGGTDSTGLLCGMLERGEPAPHAILFGDTGGEKPETYWFIGLFSEWLQARGYPGIQVLRRRRRDGSWESLEANCLRLNMLPSIAYGYKTCSQKYKVEPQDYWHNHNPVCRAEWKAGRKIHKLIGYDFGEVHRARFYDDPKYVWEYPLIDWRWKRDDCMAAIARAGLPQPAKSACFFCPHTKKEEILTLGVINPDLLQRALSLEAGAKLTKVNGLGRRLNWAQFLRNPDAAGLVDVDPDLPCGCFDGDR